MGEIEKKTYKQYALIAATKQYLIETIARNLSITPRITYTNEYDLFTLVKTELKNLNGVDFLILDLNAFTRLTKEKDFILAVRHLRVSYPSLRIVIIAEGYKSGNTLLRKTFQRGYL